MRLGGKISWVFGFLAFFVLAFTGCASSAVASKSEIPAESSTPTPFEGAWSVTEMGVRSIYLFKGNVFWMQASAGGGRPSGYQKGVISYTDTTLSLIPLYMLDPSKWATSSNYDWESLERKTRDGGFSQITRKYTFSGDTFQFGNVKHTRTNEAILTPESSVYFIQANNWIVNDSNRDWNAVFNIDEIDDQKLLHMSSIMLGTGYDNPAEQREPGIHKITFHQEIPGNSRISTISGSFTKNFDPGVYRFFAYNELNASSMPSGLPPIPSGHIRIVFSRSGFGREAELDYIDGSTTRQ